MTKIIPKDYKVEATSKPLELTEEKKTEMVAKAKTLFDKPIEAGDLADKLEQFYVESNEHYTSEQLKEVVDQVAADLYVAPEVTAEEEITK